MTRMGSVPQEARRLKATGSGTIHEAPSEAVRSNMSDERPSRAAGATDRRSSSSGRLSSSTGTSAGLPPHGCEAVRARVAMLKADAHHTSQSGHLPHAIEVTTRLADTRHGAIHSHLSAAAALAV